MFIILAAESRTLDWVQIIVQSLITIGVVFGGAGFWEFLKTKFQAKREDQKAENASNDQINKMASQMNEMSTQMTTLTRDMKDLKHDLSLLQEANEATVRYREARDKHDKELAVVQHAIIQSLTGILRERLLENYNRCMEKGYYTKEEREVYGAMYQCYVADPFNGNGVMHQLQPIMQALPWTAQEADIEDKEG